MSHLLSHNRKASLPSDHRSFSWIRYSLLRRPLRYATYLFSFNYSDSPLRSFAEHPLHPHSIFNSSTSKPKFARPTESEHTVIWIWRSHRLNSENSGYIKGRRVISGDECPTRRIIPEPRGNGTLETGCDELRFPSCCPCSGTYCGSMFLILCLCVAYSVQACFGVYVTWNTSSTSQIPLVTMDNKTTLRRAQSHSSASRPSHVFRFINHVSQIDPVLLFIHIHLHVRVSRSPLLRRSTLLN